MKYCNATKISTQEAHNNELRVDSLHDDFDSALAVGRENPRIIEVSDEIKTGDSINENGNKWQSESDIDSKK